MCHCFIISRVSTPILIMFVPDLSYCTMTNFSVCVVCSVGATGIKWHKHTHRYTCICSCLTCITQLELMTLPNFTAKSPWEADNMFHSGPQMDKKPNRHCNRDVSVNHASLSDSLGLYTKLNKQILVLPRSSSEEALFSDAHFILLKSK